jgi:hypothetical protein
MKFVLLFALIFGGGLVGAEQALSRSDFKQVERVLSGERVRAQFIHQDIWGECGSPGDSCNTSIDCCGASFCWDGTCGLEAGTCSDFGQYCGSASDCCDSSRLCTNSICF